MYGGPRVQFRHLNIIEDRWPDGEICAIRQVLQHLSNEHISAVLQQLSRYSVAIVTEHPPRALRKPLPNRDMATGMSIRLFQNPGVFLDNPPFNLTGLELRLALDAGDESEIRTYVIDQRTCEPGFMPAR
jgi:hypothetical protein